MKNYEMAIAVAERFVAAAEGSDRKTGLLAHAQAQTVLLKALLVEMSELRAEINLDRPKSATVADRRPRTAVAAPTTVKP